MLRHHCCHNLVQPFSRSISATQPCRQPIELLNDQKEFNRDNAFVNGRLHVQTLVNIGLAIKDRKPDNLLPGNQMLDTGLLNHIACMQQSVPKAASFFCTGDRQRNANDHRPQFMAIRHGIENTMEYTPASIDTSGTLSGTFSRHREAWAL